MTQNDNKYRKHLRIKGFDYRDYFACFATICTALRRCVFGDIVNDGWHRTRRGLIASECWTDIPNHYTFVELDAFVIMPNHMHGILSFVGATTTTVAATTASPLRPRAPLSNSLRAVIGSYKSAVARTIHKLRPCAAEKLWQPNYYEHIIGNDRSMDLIREYIDGNLSRWSDDEENENGTGIDRLMSFIEKLKQFDQPRGDAGVAATGEH